MGEEVKVNKTLFFTETVYGEFVELGAKLGIKPSNRLEMHMKNDIELFKRMLKDKGAKG